MKITVLGSGSAFSDISRRNSCYLLETAGKRILLDCGSDAMRALQETKTDFLSLNDIYITHMHADHAGGLPAVLTAMHVLDRKEPLSVHVPYTQIDFVRTWLVNMFIFEERLSFPFHLRAIRAGVAGLGDGVELELIETKHLEKYSAYAAARGITPVSYSVVVREGDKKFYFSSDLDSLAEAGAYIDGGTAFLESTHPPLEEIAALVKDGPAAVFFTHIPTELEEEGAWRNELMAKFGIKYLNMVRDGQVIVL